MADPTDMSIKVAFDKDGETKYITGERVKESKHFLKVVDDQGEVIGHIPYDKLVYAIGVDVTIDE